jgi:hypothetical protein
MWGFLSTEDDNDLGIVSNSFIQSQVCYLISNNSNMRHDYNIRT